MATLSSKLYHHISDVYWPLWLIGGQNVDDYAVYGLHVVMKQKCWQKVVVCIYYGVLEQIEDIPDLLFHKYVIDI